MSIRNTSRRSFIRVLAGVFAFVPAARSLAAVPAGVADGALRITSSKELNQELKARTAKGKVLALEGDSIWIKDRHLDELRLIISDASLVWKGKYNKGNDFGSYPHAVEPGDDVVALGQRSGATFSVEKMYVNIINTYVTVVGLSLEGEGAVLTYSDARVKKGPVVGQGVVKVRPDYLVDQTILEDLVNRRQQLLGTRVQVIGLPLNDGTIVASNVLI